MPNASIKKIIPCKKQDLIHMILDIEKYPEFVPWCINGKIYKRQDRADIVEIEADLTVGKKYLLSTESSCGEAWIEEQDPISGTNFSCKRFL